MGRRGASVRAWVEAGPRGARIVVQERYGGARDQVSWPDTPANRDLAKAHGGA
jgi:hypothetical protein